MGKKVLINIKLGIFDELWCIFMFLNDFFKIVIYVLGKL